jgi:hypothetical protein
LRLKSLGVAITSESHLCTISLFRFWFTKR